MKNKTAVLVVLYPTEEAFLNDYAQSLRVQTYKDFDLVIINDQSDIDVSSSIFDGLNVKEYKFSSTISKNREYGIKKVLELGYDYLIFSDIDDYYAPERIEKTLLGLSNTDIVVNDIDIVSNDKEIVVSNYFSRSISYNTLLDIEFILHHNVFGFSNTGIATRIIDRDLCFPEKLRIVDWFFYTLLLRKGVSTKFLHLALSSYRQHVDNLIGVGYYNLSNFKKLSKLKVDHFNYLSEFDEFFLPYKISSEKNTMISDQEIEKIIINKQSIIKYPLWWEIVNI